MSTRQQYEAEMAKLARRRQIAEMMQQQGMEPLGGTEMAGRLAVARSPFEGAARLAQTFVGASGQRKVDREETDLKRQRQEAIAKAMTEFETTQDTDKLATSVLDPEAFAQMKLAAATKPKQIERVDLGDKVGVYENGKLTGYEAKGVSPDAAANREASAAERAATREFTAGQNKLARDQAALLAAEQRAVTTRGQDLAAAERAKPKLSATERKQMKDAGIKLPRVQAALRRVDRVESAFNALKDNPLFNGGPIDKYALTLTKEGQEARASNAQLLKELTALTRVPGVGSQSDLEQRLEALTLPGLELGPDVNDKSISELKLFIADLQAAYQNLSSGAVYGAEAEEPAGADTGVVNFADLPP